MHEGRELVTVKCTVRRRQVLRPPERLSFLARGFRLELPYEERRCERSQERPA